MYLRLLLLASALFGCKNGDDAGAANIQAPDLHVVSAGSEPRHRLRYHAKTGTQQ